ncbi:MAG: hypothetical protein ACLFV3_10090 [Phycisphaeraceae bacterium]
MEALKRIWMQILARLEGLTASQKWLIATLLVLGTLLIGLAVMVAGQPERVPLSAFAGSRSDVMLARLRTSGIDATVEAGRVLVPREEKDQALAMLVQQDLLSADTSEAFTELIANQSPWSTDSQNKQAYLLALQEYLGVVVGKFSGVKNASVVIAMPDNQGFGRARIKPTASVTIWMEGGQRVPKDLVDSAARFVAGANRGMKPKDVSVTDANSGRTRTIEDDDEVLPTATLELVQVQEARYRQRIEDALGYIGGVIVAVNVQVDAVSRKQQRQFQYNEQDRVAREMTEEIEARNLRSGGEPGVRPNTGMDIEGGQAAGTVETIERGEAEFVDPLLEMETQSTIAGHQVQRVNATVNVPRRYFVNIWSASNPDAEQPPTDADLQPIITAQREQIEEQVQPLLQAEIDGLLKVAMVPDETLLQSEPVEAGSGGVQTLLVSQWFPTGLIALLALAAVGFMLWTVRKATQNEPLPSVEELAGLPPSLPSDEELIGEVAEGEMSLSGVELDDDEIESRKIAEQISEMIKEDPAEASMLLSRWVRKQE